jgi:hypothetical protein
MYFAAREIDGNIATVHLLDLYPTMLHILGIDHKQFSYPFRGLDVRLTGVEEAHVVEGILI